MSQYVIRFSGSYTNDAEIETLGNEHMAMVKKLAETIEPNAQGSFGIDQVEKTFSALVAGSQVGDHVESVKAAFEQAKTGLAAIDVSVEGNWTFTDDEGVVVNSDTPVATE